MTENVMKLGNGEFWQGDCLDLMADIPDNSVDMILCDLPYGTTACKWDTVIPFEPLWAHYWRVAKPNAAIVLTASQPFTTALIGSQIDRFKYCWVWDKVKGTGFLNVKKMPMRNHEDVCIFYKKPPNYNPQKTYGHERKTSFRRRELQSDVYGRVSKDTYYDSSERYPRSIITCSTDTQKSSIHPTQKPVALFEYLIRTYTNPGETVLDNCAGSGTTAIAAERTGRKWICIEQDAEYYVKATARIEKEVTTWMDA